MHVYRVADDVVAVVVGLAVHQPDFSIDLWSNGRFAMSLNYEPDYQIYDDPPCEALTMGITRDSDLTFLDQYYGMLGGLEHFVRLSRDEAGGI